MASTRFAAGPRLTWPDLPPQVRAGIEAAAGAPVVTADGQTGGFSPGMAARLLLTDGRRIFVKAVGAQLNPDSPRMHRDEAHTLAALPPAVPTPRLLWDYDDGDWVALGIEDVDGRQPHVPWHRAELDLALDVIEEMTAALTPAPTGFADLRHRMAGGFSGWRTLAAAPPDDLCGWERRNLGALAGLEASWTRYVGGSTLLHLDLRADNLLLGRDGGVRVVDWAHACAGAAWVDLVLFLISVGGEGGDGPEEILHSRELGRSAPPDGVDGLVCAFAGFLAERCRLPAPPGLPTLRAFQREYAAVALGWLRRRVRWR